MVTTYTKTGTKAVTPAKLDKTVFGVVPKNHELLKSAYVAYLANGRTNSAKTKTRGNVSGGGRKPWKQKGTGRARFGSSRNPIWRGGGIVFGPTGNENYTHKLTASAKQQATRQALSLAAAENKLIVIEELSVKSGKTNELATLLAKIHASKTTLIAVADKTEELVRASSNLANVKLTQGTYVNVYDLMNADTVLVTKDALAQLTERLTPKTKTNAQKESSV